jgi:peroxiredoxin
MLPSRLQRGDAAPAFALPDARGALHAYPGERQGATVLVFYRGHW